MKPSANVGGGRVSLGLGAEEQKHYFILGWMLGQCNTQWGSGGILFLGKT